MGDDARDMAGTITDAAHSIKDKVDDFLDSDDAGEIAHQIKDAVEDALDLDDFQNSEGTYDMQSILREVKDDARDMAGTIMDMAGTIKKKVEDALDLDDFQ